MSIGDEWAGVIAATQHAEELTAPPEGMYWVQVQGLWALRPIAGDLERSVHLSGHRPRASLEPRALSGRLLARRSTLALTTTIMHAWFGPPVDVQGSLEQPLLAEASLADSDLMADSPSALSDPDRQWGLSLNAYAGREAVRAQSEAESAGAACTAGALTEAPAPPEGEAMAGMAAPSLGF